MIIIGLVMVLIILVGNIVLLDRRVKAKKKCKKDCGCNIKHGNY